jgi:3'-phosphoadenosine 5'-phosphosulfate sulfotransferase (PAPS reductase)/FAD synthetase
MSQKQATFHRSKRSLEEIQAFTAEDLQAEIIKLLHWSEEELSQFIFESGLAYLEAYFIGDADAIDKVSRFKAFWNWFKNHWTYRDQAFLECCWLDDMPIEFRLKMYQSLHKPEVLACEIYPSSTVLGDDFSTVKTLAVI